mgnify:FL=1|jgi:hypothetical protein|tara:strand:+ start:205 stop:540 length:336 start_codon:yes stop_codon:yes gene_type:complete
MTIRYKSETFDLTTTNVTPVLTCPSGATIIVKSIQAVHDTASNVDTHALVTKSGGSAVKVSYEELNKATVNMVKGSLNLEASDILSMQAGAANEITGIVSYALIDRSQENG